jgi:hypothetical protein
MHHLEMFAAGSRKFCSARKKPSYVYGEVKLNAGVTIPPMANFDAIVKELQQERNRLDQAIAVLTSLNGRGRKISQRRSMSPAARRRIAVAQRARWAKQKNFAQNDA